MKMLKKVMAVLAVLLLVLGTMSIGVCAEGETYAIGITITADKKENLYPGDIVTFTVNISTNFRYVAMRWPVMYTLKAFEPVVANDGNGDADYGNVNGLGSTINNPDSYLESAEATTSEPFGTPYTKTNYGCLLIQWTGGTTGTGVINYYEPAGADCLTFQLRVKEGYVNNKGIGTVAIPTTSQAMDVFYLEGIRDPSDADTTFKLTPQTCTVTSAPETVSIIKEAAGIIPAEGTDTVIDVDGPHNYIYGFNTIATEGEELNETTIFKYVTLTGNATFQLIPAIPTEDPDETPVYSTGAKLKIYDANGKYLDEYTLVVFGDINGDAVVDGMDTTMLIDAFLFVEDWSYGDLKDNATFFSCDINADGMVGSDDLGPLMEEVGLVGYINQRYDADNFFIYYN